MAVFDPPDSTRFTYLNLGAGVQSSTMALMAAHGEISPMPDAAIFADTQAEPKAVYDWLEWLKDELPYPTYTVTRGNLTDASLLKRTTKKGKNTFKRLIPLFGRMPNGEIVAALGRKCTKDYKIDPIIKKIRELAEIKHGQKEITVTQWIGISWDEMTRMRDASHKWTQHRWPLLELQMKRHQCKQWMIDNGYPEPPRSACSYCPFHSNAEWRNLRDNHPIDFEKACQFDEQMRKGYAEHDEIMKMEVYLHVKCKPLREIDFDSDADKGQQEWDFGSECEGMCGL